MTFLREMNMKVFLSLLIFVVGTTASCWYMSPHITDEYYSAVFLWRYGSHPVDLYWIIPLGLLLKWPFMKEVTGYSWTQSLKPLIVVNFISFLSVAFSALILMLIFAIVMGAVGWLFGFFEFQASIHELIIPLMITIAAAIVEMTALFVIFEKVFEWNWKNFIYLCAGQTLYLGLLLLLAPHFVN